MPTQTILIIRHAEKPGKTGDVGINASGNEDSKSLTPRGWQRAGAWVQLFVPPLGMRPALPCPTAIFASAPGKQTADGNGSKSRRPLETVSPLAARLNVDVDLRFSKGGEADLAEAVAKLSGVVLICWQHEDIAAIAAALPRQSAPVPTDWPEDRFNVIYKFERADADAPWAFAQIVPVMFADDPSTPL